MTLRTVLVASLGVAALAGCDDLPEPDLDLARAVRAGRAEACVRTAQGLPRALGGAVWAVSQTGEPMTGVVPRPVVRLTGAPELIGITPGKAVFCRVGIGIDDPAMAGTATQIYEVRVGNDMGPDFADLTLRDGGGVALYSDARRTLTGGAMAWDPSILACSLHNPHAPTSATMDEALVRAAVGTWRAEAVDKGVALPAWTGAMSHAFVRSQGLSHAFARVCDPAGCDRGTASIAFDPTGTRSRPTGVLRVRDGATGLQVYRAFGFDAGSALACAHMALNEF